MARLAGVAVSYLYKWDDLKDYIQTLRDESCKPQLLPDEVPRDQPYSVKTLLEVARKRIRKLEAEIQELRRQNELYRGHVAEIYKLRDEVARLQEQLQQLIAPSPKVVPLRTV